MTTKLKKTLVMLLFTTAMFGCGGGGGGSTPAPTPTPAGTVFDLGKFTSLATGTSYSITYTGTDTAGGSYTGSQQSTVAGTTTFEGRSVIQRNMVMNITKTGVGVVLSTTAQSYYNADRTLYKTVYSNGVFATPTTTFALPTTAQIGNFAGQALSYSNGNSLTQAWQVTDAGNSVANIIVTSTTNLGLSEVDTIAVTTTGTFLSLKNVIYNFPSAGVTTTLNGVVN